MLLNNLASKIFLTKSKAKLSHVTSPRPRSLWQAAGLFLESLYTFLRTQIINRSNLVSPQAEWSDDVQEG